jgi:putative transposase
VVVAFVDDHRDRFGVEPICRVLSEHGVQIAPNSYYAHKKRPRSARSVRDERVLAEIVRVHTDPTIGRGLYGVRKVHAAVVREGGVDGRPVSRRQVERLMRTAGLQGARRGRRFVTTRPDRSSHRPPDLVKRNFTATEPNRLWVVDFTYVPTWSGMAFTAFVTDVFSRRIVGWRTAASMPTSLPLDALEMALWTRQREGRTDQGRLDGLIHHSDAGSQGGFQRSSQHLDDGGVLWECGQRGQWMVVGSGMRIGRCARRWGRRVGRESTSRVCSVSSGDGSPRACRARKQPSQSACRPRLGRAGSVTVAACRRSV